jgi:hypothetical protein
LSYLELFCEGYQIGFVNLKENDVLVLSSFEFACDMANLKIRGWGREKYEGIPLDQISNDLLKICRYATTELLVTHLREKGEVAFNDIAEVSNIAFEFVEGYMNSVTCLSVFVLDKAYKDTNIMLRKLLEPHTDAFEVKYQVRNYVPILLYSLNSLKGVLFLDCYKTIEYFRNAVISDICIVHKCKNCGRFFVVRGLNGQRNGTTYCDMPAPQNPKFNCNDPNMVRFYGKNETEIEIKKRRHKIFTTWQTRLRRHPEDETAHYVFDYFKKRDSELRIALEKGQQTESQYYEFLNSCPTLSEFKENSEAFLKQIDEYNSAAKA